MPKRKPSKHDVPDWINSAQDRKIPYTDDELEQFVTDFIADMADVPAWSDLVRDVGEARARVILKKGFLAQDERNRAN